MASTTSRGALLLILLCSTVAQSKPRIVEVNTEAVDYGIIFILEAKDGRVYVRDDLICIAFELGAKLAKPRSHRGKFPCERDPNRKVIVERAVAILHEGVKELQKQEELREDVLAHGLVMLDRDGDKKRIQAASVCDALSQGYHFIGSPPEFKLPCELEQEVQAKAIADAVRLSSMSRMTVPLLPMPSSIMTLPQVGGPMVMPQFGAPMFGGSGQPTYQELQDQVEHLQSQVGDLQQQVDDGD